MTAEYSGDPAISDKDAIRFYIGDTTDPFLYQDEEIDFLVTSEGGAPQAAVRALYGLATRFAGQADKAVGDLRISYGARATAFLAMAKELRKRTIVPVPWISGVSISEKFAVESDPDRVPSHVRVGQDDYAGPLSQRDDPRWYYGGGLY